MKPPKSRKAELAANASGGEKSRAEAKCARAEGIGLPECEARAAKRSQEVARGRGIEFKMTELGYIPVDWEVKRLGEVAMVARGGSPRPIEAFLTSHDDGLNWVKIGDVGVGAKYIERTAEKILPGGLSSTRMVYPGDFLLSNSMSFGRPYIMKIAGCIHDGWLVIQDYKTTFDTEYLYYVLGSEMVVNQYRVLAAGSSVLNLNKDVVAHVTVVVPPLAEQRRIARALSDVDELISALGKLIEKKRNIKTGAMQQLLTGKTRLPGFGAARAEFKQTELGPIPVDWEVKLLGEVCEVYDGTHKTPHYVDNGIQFYSVENVTANDFTNVKHISEEEHVALSKRAKIERGDILMTRIGSIGVCRYINWDVEASYYVSLALLKKKQDAQVNMCFLACASESEWFKDEVWLRSLQFAIPLKINLGKISEIRLYLPPLAEQKAIAAVLSDIDAEIAALEAKRAKYESIKQGMMQELLTGKTRLKGE